MSFLTWYLGRLKSHPMTTNMASAFVMMTTGDLLAQELEVRQQQQERHYDSIAPSNQNRLPMSQHANAFGYYYSLSNDPSHWETSLHDYNISLHDWNEAPASSNSNTTTQTSSKISILTHWDSFRTAAMGFWALFLITPFFVKLFQWYERTLPPSRTLLGIVSRVGISFVMSIPVNLTFFAFHSWARYTMEYYCASSCCADDHH